MCTCPCSCSGLDTLRWAVGTPCACHPHPRALTLTPPWAPPSLPCSGSVILCYHSSLLTLSPPIQALILCTGYPPPPRCRHPFFSRALTPYSMTPQCLHQICLAHLMAFGLNCSGREGKKKKKEGKRKKKALSAFGQLFNLWEIESCLSISNSLFETPSQLRYRRVNLPTS